MKVKQVIIMRTHYPDGKGGTRKVRQGKMIAQGAHAAMGVLTKCMSIGPDEYGSEDATICNGAYVGTTRRMTDEEELKGRWKANNDPAWLDLKEWLQGKFTKVVVGVETEAELLALRDQAIAAKLPHCLIQDAGDTEFGGVPTYTALAIGPANAERLDPITGGLKLL